MIFFGIPHNGLDVDDMKKMLAEQNNHPRDALLQQIQSKSDLLAFQLADFKNLIRHRKVVSFYGRGQTQQLEFVRFFRIRLRRPLIFSGNRTAKANAGEGLASSSRS